MSCITRNSREMMQHLGTLLGQYADVSLTPVPPERTAVMTIATAVAAVAMLSGAAPRFCRTSHLREILRQQIDYFRCGPDLIFEPSCTTSIQRNQIELGLIVSADPSIHQRADKERIVSKGSMPPIAKNIRRVGDCTFVVV
jgi:hypothetical protein